MSAAKQLARNLVCAGLLLVLGACINAALDNNAGMKLSGDPQALFLVWDTEHPWANRFRTQPSQYRLYAQYRQQSHLVEQDLGQAQIAGNGLRFTLPDLLRGVPDGQICLFISSSRSGASLPIRLATAGVDTARFRHLAWEEKARANTVKALSAREIKILETAVHNQEKTVKALVSTLENEGLYNSESCHARFAARTEQTSLPISKRASEDGSSRKICVLRSQNIEAPFRIDLDRLLKNALAQVQNARVVQQLKNLTHDRSTYTPHITPTYQPDVGARDEGLPLVSSLYPLIKDYRALNQPAKWPQLGELAAGVADAYTSCVDDVKKQLAVKYQAEEHARHAAPERDRLYAEHKRSTCLKRLDEKEQALRDLAELHSRIASKKIPADTPPIGPTPAVNALLNGQHCSL